MRLFDCDSYSSAGVDGAFQVKYLALLLFSTVVSVAQLNLFNAAYPPLLKSIPSTLILDSPTNYRTLGVWHRAEDLATNNGALVNANWTNRAVPTFYVAGGTDIFYSNALGQVPHLITQNRKGPITSGGSGYSFMAGHPVAVNGFTYILFGRCNTNPNNAPLSYNNPAATMQFRLGITATNTIGAFLNGLGTFEVGVSNAFTNSDFKVLGFVYSNNQARGYYNMVQNTLNTAGVTLSVSNLDVYIANVDTVEFLVFTNNALNHTQYCNLYTNYFRMKYTNANL